jgi:hypothetical protein
MLDFKKKLFLKKEAAPHLRGRFSIIQFYFNSNYNTILIHHLLIPLRS